MLELLFRVIQRSLELLNKYRATTDTDKEVGSTSSENWDILFEYELQIAKANYKMREDSYKFITDKAKAMFIVAALVGSLGFSKLDAWFPVITQSVFLIKWLVLSLVVASIILLSVSVILALIVLIPKERSVIPSCKKSVDELYKEDKHIILRSVADFYQRAADENLQTNKRIATQVYWSMICVMISFVFSMILIGIYVFVKMS